MPTITTRVTTVTRNTMILRGWPAAPTEHPGLAHEVGQLSTRKTRSSRRARITSSDWAPAKSRLR